jgi:putative transposase
VDWEGRRQVLGVELANRESSSSWKEFLLRLKSRGLRGVIFVVSDDHPGLKSAIAQVLTEASWQRCYVHFLRNSLDYLPRKADDDCLTELRWFYERRNVEEARRDLAVWLVKWQTKYPKLCEWVENNIEETFTFYRLPKEHHKHLKSTNVLERLNQELKRRTQVIRIFPNEASSLRLLRALAVEIHENWLEMPRYLNMEALREQRKTELGGTFWRPPKGVAMRPIITKSRKTNDGRWSRSGSTRDLPTIAFFRAGPLLRRNGPVPGILAAHRPGAIMDKSGRRFVVRLGQGQEAHETPISKSKNHKHFQLAI